MSAFNDLLYATYKVECTFRHDDSNEEFTAGSGAAFGLCLDTDKLVIVTARSPLVPIWAHCERS